MLITNKEVSNNFLYPVLPVYFLSKDWKCFAFFHSLYSVTKPVPLFSYGMGLGLITDCPCSFQSSQARGSQDQLIPGNRISGLT